MGALESRGRVSLTRVSVLTPYFLLSIILVVALALRWYGLAWDDGYLFHPDERQILLVASNLSLPQNLSQLLSISSPLNPHFFAYGSLPIYLLRLLGPLAPPSNISGPWADDSLARWIIFARGISGLFDLGTIALVFFLGRGLYSTRVGVAAAACVAVTVLHIQLSHFYAVDTVLTFLVLATLYAALRLAERPTRAWEVACGVTFGLALATKVSALPLVFPIVFALWRARVGSAQPVLGAQSASPLTYIAPSFSGFLYVREIWRGIRRPFLEICGIALAVFVITQPYALIDWFEFGSDVIREALVVRGWLDYPYTRQYASTLPYVYQIVQSTIWGMGLPLGFFAWGGTAVFLYKYWRQRGWRGGYIVSWALVYFILVGAQYAKYPRYMLPLLPALYVMASQGILSLRWHRWIPVAALCFVLGVSLIYSIAFVSIYGREHPWLTTSRWIFENLPRGSTVAVEEWDDALPVQVAVGGVTHRGSEFKSITLSLYGPDDNAKLQAIADALARTDLVILASQRAYGSVGRLAERYPLTTRYYQKLFSGELGFELTEEASNFPQLAGWSIADDPRAGLPFAAIAPEGQESGRVWNWGFADESLTVYDHPQPLVFRKSRDMTSAQLFDLLRQ